MSELEVQRPGDRVETCISAPPRHVVHAAATAGAAPHGPVDDGRRSDVRRSLARVAHTLVPDVREDLALGEVTSRHGLPDFDLVALVDLTGPAPDVAAASRPGLRAALDVEARLGQGPLTTSAAVEEAVVCRDLRRDPRWPAYRRFLFDGWAPLRRWVVVPLRLPGERPVGSLVLAASRPGIVPPDQLITIGALADHAALELTAHVAAGREARAVLATDDVRAVAVAVGRVMETRGLTEPEALAWLKDGAHEAGMRLPDAARVVDP